MTSTPLEVVQEYVRRYNDRALDTDPSGVVAHDVVLKPSTGPEVSGSEGFRQHIAAWLKACPDNTASLLRHKVHGAAVLFTLRYEGTFTGQLDTPNGPIHGTGKTYRSDVPIEVEVRDGQIVRMVSNYDVNDFLGQVMV